MTQKKNADPLLEYCQSHDLALIGSGDESEREAEIERIYGIVRERGYEPTDRMREALAFLDYDKSHNKWVLSPNKAAIFINTSGNSLQGRLRYGSAYGYRTLMGWWKIPTDIVIELWYKQVKKEERLNGDQNS